MIPADRRYTADHEWAQQTGSGNVLRIGITEYAQENLGDIVYVSLPEVGQSLEVGQSFGEVESTKSVSDLYAPVAGTITARNEELTATPELVNTDPFGAGWMVEIEATDAAAVEGLLDAQGYGEVVGTG
ncbi:MAG: glycine cleavage system protein GcvH [Geodermatophilaceae bacterium]|nr:glycine cleavage system protein GcvH [Geodermatophilaceae bacterium]